MRVLRRHFACLPLQISHFDRLGELAERVLPSGANVSGLPPRMDSAGHILVDDTQFNALAEAVAPALADPNYLDQVEVIHHQHLDTLVRAMDLAAAPGALTVAANDLGEAIAALAPYGLFTKLVPPRLREAALCRIATLAPNLDGEAKERLLEPTSPPSAVFALSLLEVARALVGAGVDLAKANSPEALPAAARDTLMAYCADLTGYGPHAWEAPGYESAVILLANLHSRFSGLDGKALDALLLRQHQRRTLRQDQQAELDARWLAQDQVLARQVSALRYWTAYVDEQATRMRRAFHLGWLPLLRRLAKNRVEDANISDLLFLTREEITAGNFPRRVMVIRERREEYLRLSGRTDYPVVSPQHLDDLITGLGVSGAFSAAGSARVLPARVVSASGCLPGLSAAARGAAQGPARVLGPGGDMMAVPAGAILVTSLVTPDMAPLFWNIAGVVVEEGGLLQHATALAREFGLPCVVGCVGASELIRDGDLVQVDGVAGLVRFAEGGEGIHAAFA